MKETCQIKTAAFLSKKIFLSLLKLLQKIIKKMRNIVKKVESGSLFKKSIELFGNKNGFSFFHTSVSCYKRHRKPEFYPKGWRDLLEKEEIKSKEIKVSEPLKYPLKEVIPTTPTGWMPPQGADENVPFKVYRSKSGNLPVYRDFKLRRSKVTTILRKYTGNVDVSAFFFKSIQLYLLVTQIK